MLNSEQFENIFPNHYRLDRISKEFLSNTDMQFVTKRDIHKCSPMPHSPKEVPRVMTGTALQQIHPISVFPSLHPLKRGIIFWKHINSVDYSAGTAVFPFNSEMSAVCIAGSPRCGIVVRRSSGGGPDEIHFSTACVGGDEVFSILQSKRKDKKRWQIELVNISIHDNK